MPTQPEKIIDKNGKPTTVHRSTGKTAEPSKKRAAPKPKLAANGLRPVAEFDENIARLKNRYEIADDDHTAHAAAEQVLMLEEIRGHGDGEDMMSVDGVLAYFSDFYPEDHEFFVPAEEIRRWVLGQ